MRVRLKVVEDNGDDQVEHDERAKEDETHEEKDGARHGGCAPIDVIHVQLHVTERGIAPVEPFPRRLHLHALLRDHAVVHYAVPRFPGCAAEEQEETRSENFKVGVARQAVLRLDGAEEVHPHHREDEEEEE